MAKKEKQTEALVVLSDDLQKSLDSLSNFKQQAETIKANCELIVVSDDTTLAIAQQNLSKANDLLKFVEEKRVQIKAPYLVASKEIDRIGAELKEPIQSGIDHIKKQIKEWDAKLEEKKKEEQRLLAEKAEEEAKALEEQQKKDMEILNHINVKLTNWFKDKLTSVQTPADADAILAYIQSNYKPREFFGKHADLAYELKSNYVTLIENKKQMLISADIISDEEMKLMAKKEEIAKEKERLAAEERETAARLEEARIKREKEEAEKKAEEERKALQEKQDAEKTSGVRKIWKFELVDKSKLPIEWIALDESAVKAYMKSEDMKEGIVNGVRFYQEASVRA